MKRSFAAISARITWPTCPVRDPYLDTILESIGTVPRNLKRYINAVAFTMWAAERRQAGGGEDFRLELLIKMSLIVFLLPELYKQLTSYPHHLLFIQENLWERGARSRRRRPSRPKRRRSMTFARTELSVRWR